MHGYEAPSPFVSAWNEIEAMLEDGEPFPYIEETIERSPFDDDQRAALWLASWALVSRGRRETRAPGARAPRHLAAVD